MTTMVALLQGINIGPKRRIRMADLKSLVEDLGHTNVRTYVNSGNVVFETERRSTGEIVDTMTSALAGTIGVGVPVVVRTVDELAEVVANNPFPAAAADPKTLHVTFLSDVPDRALVEALANIERGEDDCRVVGKDVYLYYPNLTTGAVFMPTGLGKALGVTATSRNWRTVTTLLAMCEGE